MLRLVGSLLVMAASVGLAYRIRRDMTEHLRLLYEIRRLFVDISYGAEHTMQPVEVLLGCFIKTKDDRLNELCREIADCLMEHREANGEAVWQSVYESYKKELGLSGEELEIIAGAGSAFFGKSVEENKRHLALGLERLEHLIEGIRSEQKEKQRVYQTVSIMCGFLIIILLL